MTLIELVVATTAGAVIFLGLTTVVITSMHQTTRITNRVHATQQARTAVHGIVNSLHSACVASQFAPVQTDSTGTLLRFISATGSEVSPTPVLHSISLSGTTITESIYPYASGTAPRWTFSGTPSSTRQLMTRVSPISGSSIFSYYGYTSGQISATPFSASPLGANAASTVQVTVALKVAPRGSTVTDAKAAAHVQDSALLRFTPPTFNTSSANLPCE
jgi:Tfp pilus assembly protein PilW